MKICKIKYSIQKYMNKKFKLWKFTKIFLRFNDFFLNCVFKICIKLNYKLFFTKLIDSKVNGFKRFLCSFKIIPVIEKRYSEGTDVAVAHIEKR